MSIDVLTVSSKGQIVLPAEMRKRLSIGSGAKLAAYASDDVIMLKLITIPTERDFSESLMRPGSGQHQWDIRNRM